MLSRALIFLTLVVSLGLAAAITPSFAQMPSEDENSPSSSPTTPPPVVPGERFLEQLNLTADQQEEIAEIREQYQSAITENHEALDAAQQELKEMMMTENSDTAQLRAKYAEVMDLREDLANSRFETMLAIREILTPQQRQELAEIVQTHWQNSRHHHERWR